MRVKNDSRVLSFWGLPVKSKRRRRKIKRRRKRRSTKKNKDLGKKALKEAEVEKNKNQNERIPRKTSDQDHLGQPPPYRKVRNLMKKGLGKLPWEKLRPDCSDLENWKILMEITKKSKNLLCHKCLPFRNLLPNPFREVQLLERKDSLSGGKPVLPSPPSCLQQTQLYLKSWSLRII